MRRLDHEHRFLSGAEINAVLAAATRAYYAPIYIAVWTGMRESEVLGLTWGDLDLKAGKINLRAQLSRAKERQPPERVPLKTDKTRSIDIDPELVSFLWAHRERHFAVGRAKETDYVFTTESGAPLHHRNLTKAFGKAADRAGLNPAGKRRLRFHDLRRTYASILINGGAGARTSHSSSATPCRRCTPRTRGCSTRALRRRRGWRRSAPRAVLRRDS